MPKIEEYFDFISKQKKRTRSNTSCVSVSIPASIDAIFCSSCLDSIRYFLAVSISSIDYMNEF